MLSKVFKKGPHVMPTFVKAMTWAFVVFIFMLGYGYFVQPDRWADPTISAQKGDDKIYAYSMCILWGAR